MKLGQEDVQVFPTRKVGYGFPRPTMKEGYMFPSICPELTGQAEERLSPEYR